MKYCSSYGAKVNEWAVVCVKYGYAVQGSTTLHKISNRIGNVLKRRNIAYSFLCADYNLKG